ncbi:MAG: hypothetical protein JWM53_6255 [bacterium]|nr:hypothetical protein [bacterium]
MQALANELRHTRTRLLPLQVAERLQHAIVRLEALCFAPADPDPAGAEAAYRDAKQLLDDCHELLGRP